MALESNSSAPCCLPSELGHHDSGLLVKTVWAEFGFDTKAADAFVKEIGADINTFTVDELLTVRLPDIEAAIDNAKFDGASINAVQRASLVRAVRIVAVVCGMRPPALGCMADIPDPPQVAPIGEREDVSSSSIKPGRLSAKLSRKRGFAAMDRRKDGRYLRTSDDEELCFDWNRHLGGCADVCVAQPRRAHCCEWCLEDHRAIDESCPAPRRPPGWAPSHAK